MRDIIIPSPAGRSDVSGGLGRRPSSLLVTTTRQSYTVAKSNPSPNMNDPILNHLIQLAENEPDVTTLWLYGSRARGDHHSGSDYDLAVLFREPVNDPLDRRLRPEEKALEWQSALNLSEGSLSVVDLAIAPIPLGISVLEQGRLLVDKAPEDRIVLESRILSKWEIDYLYHQKRFG